MTLLESIHDPGDVRQLDPSQLADLAAELRDHVVTAVAKNGGHLGPNLGVVELTIALHRVFESPHDRILFDIGHQAYVHKMLTGRTSQFSTLRQAGGLSGYASREESEHDLIENSHASTVLSYADGMAKAYAARGEADRAVVAVIGDGALTGGMAWEALNNIAAAKDRPVVIVVNDNGRSYSPTIGGLANHLASLRVRQGYEQVLELVKDALGNTPVVGAPLYDTLHGMKKGIKDILNPQAMFEDLGLKYLGPIDGNDEQTVEWALQRARDFGGPVIVHCLTRKGLGYEPAERDAKDCLHQAKAFDVATGEPLKKAEVQWTQVFSEELLAVAAERPDVVGVTAAMLHPTGMATLKSAYPDRVYDVGIAEQHAVTSAAGLAMGGLHPVVAVYATFLNRAFDQVLMDVGLHQQPVTFVLDRAGVTGDDGPSHNGMWDMSVLQIVPGLAVAAPRDGTRVREQLREAVAVDDGPTAVRIPKGPVIDDIPAIDTVGGMDVLHRSGEDVLIVAAGIMAEPCMEVAGRLGDQGIEVTVVDPRWVKPLDPALVQLAGRHRLVATVEDNGRVGGVGAAVAQLLADAEVDTPVRNFGIPQRYLDTGKRPEVLAQVGLSAQDLARDIVETVARRAPALEEQPVE